MGTHSHPTDIRYIEAEDSLHMVFNDGHEATYPTIYLRGYCTCALCQGHAAGPTKWNQPLNRTQIIVENVTPVGTYALCITWQDGHDTGIYTFESLREICPCSQCMPKGLPEAETRL